MYYVLMTDLVRVPSPTLESQIPPQYLYGLSISGHMAQGDPDQAPPPLPTSPPPPPAQDPDLAARVQNLQNAAAGPGGIGPAIASELGPIAPWTWMSFDSVMLTDGTATLQVPIIAPPNLDGTSFTALQKALGDHLSFKDNGSFPFLVDSPNDSPPYTPFRGRGGVFGLRNSVSVGSRRFAYESFVSSLAAAPAPLPHGQMNLVRFFIVTDTQLGTLTKAANGVAAIPVFTTANGTSFAGAALAANTYFIADPAKSVAQWQYDHAFNGFKVIAYTQTRDPRAIIDSPNSFVNMKTLWVRRQHANVPGAGSPSPNAGVSLDDWVQNLPRNLAKLFDLPRRFLDLFRDQDGVFLAVPLQITDPDITSRRLVHATLRALYDVLAPGIWGSQGDQTKGRSGLARTAAMAVYSSSDTPAAKSTVDSVLGALWAQDGEIRSDFAPKTEDWINRTPQTTAFRDALAARVGASLGLPQKGEDFIAALFAAVGAPATPPADPLAGPPPPQADTKSANLEILDRLVTLATNPDTAADIFADLWIQAVSNAGTPQPYKDIRDIAGQLGLPDAQRRQIASFALAQGGIRNTGPSSSRDIELLKSNIFVSLFGYVLGTLTNAPTAGPPPVAPNVDPETVFATSGVRAECLDRTQILSPSPPPPLPQPPPLPPLPLPPLLFIPAIKSIWDEIAKWVPQASGSAPPFKSYDFVPAQKTTAEASGLNFQLDRVVLGDGNATQANFNSLLAGYGFLMRRALRKLQPGQDAGDRDKWDIIRQDSWRLLNAVQGASGPWPIKIVTIGNPPVLIPIPVPDQPELPAGRFHSTADATQPLELLAPTPIASSGGMPRVSFQYNNAAPAGTSTPSQVTHLPTPEMAVGAPNVFHLIQPTTKDNPNPPARQLLPFLAYGLTYDLIVFAMTNQGAIPEQLRADAADATHPAFPAAIPAGSTPAESDQNVDVENKLATAVPENFKALVRSARYLRTTSIGHLALHVNLNQNVSTDPQLSGYDPFLIPKDVALVAAEIPELRRKAGDDGNPVSGRKACLLLADVNGAPLAQGNASSRPFKLSAPACSVEVLDRWLARDEFAAADGLPRQTIAQLRRKIRGLYADALKKRQADVEAATQAGKPVPADLDNSRLEDPAVGGLVVTTQLFRRAGQPATGLVTQFFQWDRKFDKFMTPGAAMPSSLPDLCRDGAAITFQIVGQPPTDNLSPPPPVTSGTPAVPSVVVSVAAGDVVLVTLQAAVRKDYFDVDNGPARFDPIVLSDPTTSVPGNDTSGPADFRVFDPIEIVIEAAQADLPDPESLYTACDFKVDAGNGQRQILLDWNRVADDRKWDAVGAVETGDIAWSFTGRPVTRYPFEFTDYPNTIPGQSDTPATNPLLWEIEAFADRATLAPAVKVFPIPLTQAGSLTPLRIPIQTLSSRGPAGVKRYEIVVRNRYAAAYQQVPNSGVVASRRAKHTVTHAPPGKLLWVDSYRRLVVQAVPPDTVPEPSVRALVPLTRSMDDDKGAAVAGLLVVLNGAFGDVGGVAEWLDAGVDVIEQKIPVAAFSPGQPPPDSVPVPTQPHASTKVMLRRAEIGADPLVRRGPRGDDKAGGPLSPIAGYGFMPLQVTGPLGHTFDTAATVGLFNATSFVVEPPQVTAADPGAWWMAKLKLRRTIMAEGIAQGTPVTFTDPTKIMLPDSPQGYLGQWSFNLLNLPLTVQSVIQTIGVSAQRIGGGATQPAFVCWANDPKFDPKQPALAIWLAPQIPTVIRTAIPDEAWRIPYPQNAATVSAGLRLIFVPTLRRVQRWDDTGTVMTPWVVLSYNASLQVRTTGDWVFAGDFDWWTDKASDLPDGTYEERLQVTLSWPSGLLQTAQKAFVCVAPQASDWVESHWGQFLPEANRLGTVRLGKVAVQIAQDPTQLQITGADWWLNTSDLAVAANRSAQKSNQGLFHLLMLSRTVRSANGRDSEAFIGLYWDNEQPTPAHGKLILRPAGNSAANNLSAGGSTETLRWRLLTIRTGNPDAQTSAAIVEKLKDNSYDPWKLFFPDERDSGVTVVPDRPSDATMMPRDASLQILEISGRHTVG
jgi:hypothetical protein